MSNAHYYDILRFFTIVFAGLIVGMALQVLLIYSRIRVAAPRTTGILFRHVVLVTAALIGYVVVGAVEVGLRLGHSYFNWTTPCFLALEILGAYAIVAIMRFEKTRLRQLQKRR